MTRTLSTEKLRALRDRLAAMQSSGFQERLQKLCSASALKLVADGFRRSQAPDGTSWAPLKSRKGQPLRKSGRLQHSFACNPITGGIRIWTAVGYAGYQQGGTGVYAGRSARRVASRVARQSAKGRFVGPNAKTAFLVRIREHENPGIIARPMVPTAGPLPDRWREAFARDLNAAVRQQLKENAS